MLPQVRDVGRHLPTDVANRESLVQLHVRQEGAMGPVATTAHAADELGGAWKQQRRPAQWKVPVVVVMVVVVI